MMCIKDTKSLDIKPVYLPQVSLLLDDSYLQFCFHNKIKYRFFGEK
jgi:hypothetical protein